MAFAVHITKEHCTGCINCVVACPVDAPELHTVDLISTDEIAVVRNGDSVIPGFRGEFLMPNGICVQACPYGVIRIAGPREANPGASVQ